MALNFHHIFCRIGMRRFHINSHYLIDNAAVGIKHMPVNQSVRRISRQLFVGIRLKNLFANCQRLFAAYADNADSAFTQRRADSADGFFLFLFNQFFLHNLFSKRKTQYKRLGLKLRKLFF